MKLKLTRLQVRKSEVKTESRIEVETEKLKLKFHQKLKIWKLRLKEDCGRGKRREKNRKKKSNKRDKLRKLKTETASKAKNMVGIGPISPGDVDLQRKSRDDYENAKIAAVKLFLRKNLKYNDSELEELRIVATKTGKDNTIYIAVEEHWMLKDLYTRKADCRREGIVFKPFVPPQFHARFVALGRICAAMRDDDSELRTQLRFNNHDIEILTKNKGSGEGFRIVKMEEFIGEETIPEFDNSIKWKFKQDRPPRRQVTSSPYVSPGNSPAKEQHPANGKNTRQSPSGRPASKASVQQEQESTEYNVVEEMRSPMVRQRSVNDDMEDSTEMKRPKTTALIEVNEDGSFNTPMGEMNITDIQ